MIESMATVHMPSDEVANDFAAVLENIRKAWRWSLSRTIVRWP